MNPPLNDCYHGLTSAECLCGNLKAQPGQYCCAKKTSGPSPSREKEVRSDRCPHDDCFEGETISKYPEDGGAVCYCGDQLTWKNYGDYITCCKGEIKTGPNCI
ncbi:hypothetical protein HYU11_00875 [Candidatus Woesearchaeota archaeon]|nr:hypothetical protein [Candidatus Woesearchaeota archaeon]